MLPYIKRAAKVWRMYFFSRGGGGGGGGTPILPIPTFQFRDERIGEIRISKQNIFSENSILLAD